MRTVLLASFPVLLGLLLLAGLLFVGCRTASAAHDHHHRFDDADAWAARFEDPTRDGWQKPDEVIAALALAEDAKVADIGSATGYFPVRFAKAVPKGHVYGMDIESSMVDYLNRRAEREGLANLSSHVAEFADAKIPQPVDLVLMVNTYHHIEGRPAYFTKLAQSLKPGGRLAIIDFTQASKMGPTEKLPASQVVAELKTAGYSLAQKHEFLPEQFFYVFTR